MNYLGGLLRVKRETRNGVLDIVTLADIKAAQSRISGVAARTPLLKYPVLLDGRSLYLKPENFQPMGAFKIRGAFNKIASLTVEQRSHGVITYSSGNHAQGVAYAARELGTKAIVVMPENAPKIKVEATRDYGAEVVFVGPSSHERKAKAEELAQAHHYQIIPPYNDEKIIAGQGTIALEIFEDLPEVETVLCPVGGGGLISGVSAGLKLQNPKIKMIGVEPELANDAQQSLRAGHIVSLSAEQVNHTLADGLRTQSVGEINFQHISQYVDEIITVTEDEIRAAVRRLAMEGRLVVEPSGAVGFAAFLFHAEQLPATKNNVVVISGGNIAPEMLAEVLCENP